jgi:hypothetical protein
MKFGKKKKEENGNWTLNLENYYYKYFVFRTAIKAKNYIKPRS